METGRSERRHHRRKRRSRRRLKFILLLVGTLSLLMGGALTAGSLRLDNERMRTFGLMYLAAGAACLAGFYGLVGYSLIRRSRRERPAARAQPAAGRAGAALLVALLLMGLLTGTAMEALRGARVALRRAERLRAAALLRVAATDSVWQTLRALSRPPPPGGGDRPAEWQTAAEWPSGVKTTVHAQRLDRNRLPVVLRPPAAEPGTAWYRVSARAAGSGLTRGLRAYASRSRRGEVAILAWVELP